MEDLEKVKGPNLRLRRAGGCIAMGMILLTISAFAQSGISITELMYHPMEEGDINGTELEFIEIQNISESSIDLTAASFTDGVDFTFGPNSILDPGEYCVLVSNVESFMARYPGVAINGQYNGQLSNDGENLELRTQAGDLLEAVSYNNTSPWPAEAVGNGKSLVKKTPTSIPDSPSDASAWRPSFAVSGSPGQADPTPQTSSVIINELLAHTDLPNVDSVEIHNPGSAAADIGGWYLSDELSNPQKYQIPSNTQIPPGGFLVLSEADFGAESQGEAGFRFSSRGDSAWLSSAIDGTLSGYTHGFVFGASANGISFCRYIDSQGIEHFAAAESVTLGSPNSPPKSGRIVISELLYKQGETGIEFVELINQSAETVSLFDPENPANTWKINGLVFDFPEDVSLHPNQVAVVASVDEATFTEQYGDRKGVLIFGPFAGALNNEGEEIVLQRPDKPDEVDGEIVIPYIDVDAVSYGITSPWPVPDTGASIEKISRSLWGLDPENWRVSLASSGSPGTAQDLDYATWQRIHFLDSEIAESHLVKPEDDFEGDGLLNISEYAFGSDPRTQQILTNPQSIIVLDSGMPYPGISFRQSIYATDLIYQIQESENLSNWQDALDYIQWIPNNNGDITTLAVYRRPDPLKAPDKAFHRLKLILEQ